MTNKFLSNMKENTHFKNYVIGFKAELAKIDFGEIFNIYNFV